MAEITHADLQAMATDIKESTRRDVDLLRDEFRRAERGIYHRVDELKDRLDTQNGRVNKAEDDIAAMRFERHTVSAAGAPVSVSEPLVLTRKQKAALTTLMVTLGLGLLDLLAQAVSAIAAAVKRP